MKNSTPFSKHFLKEFANCQTGPFGSQLHEEDYVDDGTPIVTVEHLGEVEFSHQNLPFVSDADKKRLSKYILKEGDIVFSRVGSVDRCTYVSKCENGWMFSGRCIRVRCNSDISSKYLSFYFRLNSFKEMMRSIAVGATMPSLNTSLMDSIPLFLPEKSYQKKVSDVLTCLDEKIKLNNRINAELETMAKTLYDYWFVQFDFPDEKGRPYKSSGGKMVYNKVLKRKIPEGWTVNSMGDWVADDKTGDWGKDIAEGNYSLPVDCIRGADINGINGNDRLKPPLRYILQKNAQKILSPLDLIVEISGGSPVQSTGRLAYLIDETLDRFEHPLICSNFCKAITLKNRCYFFNFAYQWKFIYDHGILFGWEGKTSGIKNLLFDSFATKYKVCMPPEKIAQNFYECIYPLEKEKQKMLKENEKLSSLRDWLLPMLMNGQVKVG